MDWYNTQGYNNLSKVEEIDETSSDTINYVRRNLTKVADNETDFHWEFEEARLTDEEMKDYKTQKEIETLKAQNITLMSALADICEIMIGGTTV